MDEQEKKTQTPKKQSADEREERMRPVRALAGIYLFYLAFQLGKGFLETESWTTMKIVTLVAAIAFVLIGGWLVISNVKDMLPKKKEPEAEEDQSTEEDND